jgi:hypothetical protein
MGLTGSSVLFQHKLLFSLPYALYFAEYLRLCRKRSSILIANYHIALHLLAILSRCSRICCQSYDRVSGHLPQDVEFLHMHCVWCFLDARSHGLVGTNDSINILPFVLIQLLGVSVMMYEPFS